MPSYWLCALIGLSVCSVIAFVRHRSFQSLLQVDITNIAAFLLIGMVLGGRCLSILTMVPLIVRNWSTLSGNFAALVKILSNGMVFYGGLFGALLAMTIYIRRYQLDRNLYFDYLVPLFPLFHAFGRIGCFLTGCCHGKVSETLGIAFAHSTSAENGIPYFPIQLVCAAGNLVLFLVLLYYEQRHHGEGKTLDFYLTCYAIGRFFIEFFRGDTIRGILFGLSTSQWISILILSALVIRVHISRRKKQPGNMSPIIL